MVTPGSGDWGAMAAETPVGASVAAISTRPAASVTFAIMCVLPLLSLYEGPGRDKPAREVQAGPSRSGSARTRLQCAVHLLFTRGGCLDHPSGSIGVAETRKMFFNSVNEASWMVVS